MPSLRNVLKGIAFTTLLTLASTAPVPEDEGNACGPTPPSHTISSIKVVATSTAPAHTSTAVTSVSAPPRATPTLPLTGDTPDLVPSNLTLQYVALGRGVQNYTCTGAGANSTSDGAVATLYDATALAYADEAFVLTLPASAVNFPIDSAGTFSTAVRRINLPVLGHHFFDSVLTPTFDLTSVDKILYAAKTADVKAPADASKGPAGTGAVDWLYLKAKTGYTSVGLNAVYRVETAGGNATPCTEAGIISVQYSALYFFY